MTEAVRAPRWAAPVTLALVFVGLAVSAYLTYTHYTEPTALSCPDTGALNCVKVTTSAESMLFGFFPVALAGLLYFIALVPLMLPAAWRSSSPLLRWGRVGGLVAGLGMVCYLVYVEAAVVHAICIWCTVVHVVTFALLLVVLAATLVPPLPDEPVPPVTGRSYERTPR